MKNCENCEEPLAKQKSYCSRKCQAAGVAKQNTKAIREKKKCENCKIEFLFCTNWKSNKNKRYCSRLCKDDHQKTIYCGENNPRYGVSPSEETRTLVRESQKLFWSKKENVNNHSTIMKQVFDNFKEKNGYALAHSEPSKQKRKKTCKEKYGFEHPWKNKDVREKCEKTTIELYGKTSQQIAREFIPKKNTRIEKIVFELLTFLQIEFVHLYVLGLNLIKREFDFYIPEMKTLIECDGDYWHANPSFYKDKNYIQEHNLVNDNIKNQLAKDAGLRLLRFWESDIINENFPEILFKALWEKR